MLSIIIPARNEADNLEDILQYFLKGLHDIEFEVILVNDFSDDNTLEKSQNVFRVHKNFRVVRASRNYLDDKKINLDFLIADYEIFKEKTMGRKSYRLLRKKIT